MYTHGHAVDHEYHSTSTQYRPNHHTHIAICSIDICPSLQQHTHNVTVAIFCRPAKWRVSLIIITYKNHQPNHNNTTHTSDTKNIRCVRMEMTMPSLAQEEQTRNEQVPRYLKHQSWPRSSVALAQYPHCLYWLPCEVVFFHSDQFLIASDESKCMASSDHLRTSSSSFTSAWPSTSKAWSPVQSRRLIASCSDISVFLNRILKTSQSLCVLYHEWRA